METEKWCYNTQVQLNKPIRMMGLSSLQAFGAIAVLGLNIVLGLSIFKMSTDIVFINEFILIVAVMLISIKLKKEHKKGNPDYISSLITWSSTPKYILDREHLFNYLIKTDE